MATGVTRSEQSLRTKIEAARRAAEALDGHGLAFEAEAVRALCRTASSLHETASRLGSDNADLRSQLQGVKL